MLQLLFIASLLAACYISDLRGLASVMYYEEAGCRAKIVCWLSRSIYMAHFDVTPVFHFTTFVHAFVSSRWQCLHACSFAISLQHCCSLYTELCKLKCLGNPLFANNIHRKHTPFCLATLCASTMKSIFALAIFNGKNISALELPPRVLYHVTSRCCTLSMHRPIQDCSLSKRGENVEKRQVTQTHSRNMRGMGRYMTQRAGAAG